MGNPDVPAPDRRVDCHSLFPLLKTLMDLCDCLPLRRERPEVLEEELEKLLNTELSAYQALSRSRSRQSGQDDADVKMDEMTTVLLDEIKAVLDNCRQIIKLQKLCTENQEALVARIRANNQVFSRKTSEVLARQRAFQDSLDEDNKHLTSSTAKKRRASEADCSSAEPGKLSPKRRFSESSVDDFDRGYSAEAMPRTKLSPTSRCSSFSRTPSCSDSDGTDNVKTSFRHPTAVTRNLKEWFRRNIEYPYPSPYEKAKLIEDARRMFGYRLSQNQLNNWFINERRRKDWAQRHRSGAAGNTRSSSSSGNEIPVPAHGQPPATVPSTLALVLPPPNGYAPGISSVSPQRVVYTPGGTAVTAPVPTQPSPAPITSPPAQVFIYSPNFLPPTVTAPFPHAQPPMYPVFYTAPPTSTTSPTQLPGPNTPYTPYPPASPSSPQ